MSTEGRERIKPTENVILAVSFGEEGDKETEIKGDTLVTWLPQSQLGKTKTYFSHTSGNGREATGNVEHSKQNYNF